MDLFKKLFKAAEHKCVVCQEPATGKWMLNWYCEKHGGWKEAPGDVKGARDE